MSLINSMLRDLDKRRAGDEARKGLPSIVRPLPAARAGAPKVTAVIVGLLVIFAAASAWWYSQPTFVAPVPVVAVAVVPPAPTPPPVEIKPAEASEPIALPPTPQPQATPAEVTSPVPVPETNAPKAETPLASSPPAAVLGALRLDGRLKTAPKPNPATGADDVAKPVSKPVPAPVAIRPEREEDDWQRAQGLLRENRSEQAEPLLRRALQSQPSNAAIRQALIGMLLTARRHAEAADQMRQGLALTPEQTTWAMNLARLHVEKNDYPAAWEVLAKSASYAQQSAEYLAFCGTVLQRLSRSSEALPYYRNALQIKPREGRWWVGYGIALEADGKAADARESYQRARILGELPTEVMNFVEQKLR